MPFAPTAPSSGLPVEVSMNLLICRSEKRHGAPLDPCFTLALNMQSLMLIAAAEVFLMSLNINCAHPLDIMDRSDHYLVHNDVRDNRRADPFNLKPANFVGLTVALAMGLDSWIGGGEFSCSHQVLDIILTIIPRTFKKRCFKLNTITVQDTASLQSSPPTPLHPATAAFDALIAAVAF